VIPTGPIGMVDALTSPEDVARRTRVNRNIVAAFRAPTPSRPVVPGRGQPDFAMAPLPELVSPRIGPTLVTD